MNTDQSLTDIVIQTNDKQEFVLPRNAIFLSKLLTDLLQDGGDEGEDSTQTTVPLANVDGPTFGVPETVWSRIVWLIDILLSSVIPQLTAYLWERLNKVNFLLIICGQL